MMLDAFPDFQITIEDEIAEGDRVVLRETLSDTHQGELIDIPATGAHHRRPGGRARVSRPRIWGKRCNTAGGKEGCK